MLALPALFIVAVHAASFNECQSTNCVMLSDQDMVALLSQSILTQHQLDYLRSNYYHQIDSISSQADDDKDTTAASGASVDTDTSVPPPRDAETVSAYQVVTTFVSTANLLYCFGCCILTVAYLVLMYWFRRDAAYFLIALTLGYHYIFHTIANLLAHTISSRFLAAILYIACCNMPTICLAIYFVHPQLCNAYATLKTMALAINAEIEGNPDIDSQVSRLDIFFAQRAPNKLFYYAFLLCLTSMVTPFVYANVLRIEFIGVFAVFAASLYALIMVLSAYSLKSNAINALFARYSKSCLYGDCRLIYASMAYGILHCFTAFVSPQKRTICLISGLNALCWSLPAFLFLDVFQPKLSVDWKELQEMVHPDQLRQLPMQTINVVLSLLQQHNNLRYKLWVVTNIVINLLLLQQSMHHQSWLAVPYAVLAVFFLSFAVPVFSVWGIVVHMAITYALFQACFAYVHIIDIATLQSFSWLAPDNILLWIITTAVRLCTTWAASVQITRAIYWVILPKSKWQDQNLKVLDATVHVVVLYSICALFLYFTYLEPNGFISFVFEIFGMSYGATLVWSARQILTAQQRPWLLFVLNMALNLRFYALSYRLLIPRILTFLGSLMSFRLLQKKGDVEMRLNTDTDVTVAVIVGIVMYSVFGLYYDCKVLIFSAVVVLCGYVSFKVYKRTNSKRAALIALSILAVLLIQMGLRFESASFHELMGLGVGAQSEYVHKTWELSLIDYLLS